MHLMNNNMSQAKQILIWKNEADLADISVNSDETVDVLGVFTEGFVDKQKLSVRLNGHDAKLKMSLIFVGNAEEEFDLQTVVEHLDKSSVSEIIVRAVLLGKSSINFAGKVIIPGTAQRSETDLRFQTLLLSPYAQARTIPSLEIIANDVKAGHSASVGRLDEELLFYLQTRGFDKSSASELLIEGFLKEALCDLDDDQQIEQWNIISHKLASHTHE